MKAASLLMLILGVLAQQPNNTTTSTLLQQMKSLLSNQTETVRNHTLAIQSILSSDCGDFLEQQFSLHPASNYTLFLPSDEAFGSLSGLILSGLLQISCWRREKNCTTHPFTLFATNSHDSSSSLLDCIPEILAYHVVPNNTFYIHSHVGNNTSLNQTTGPFQNITVLETALNSAAFVNLPGKTGQAMVVNKTADNTFVDFGFERPVRVVHSDLNMTFPNGTGIIHLIDGILIPPFPLNLTLQVANLTLFADSISSNYGSYGNNSTAQSIYNATGITVFAPVNEAIQSGSIDPLRYVVQESVIYANSSLSLPINLTNMANETIALSLTNDSLQFGNATVVHANIPISNGVLHVIDSLVLGNHNSTTNVRSTNQNGLIGRGGRITRLVG